MKQFKSPSGGVCKTPRDVRASVEVELICIVENIADSPPSEEEIRQQLASYSRNLSEGCNLFAAACTTERERQIADRLSSYAYRVKDYRISPDNVFKGLSQIEEEIYPVFGVERRGRSLARSLIEGYALRERDRKSNPQ